MLSIQSPQRLAKGCPHGTYQGRWNQARPNQLRLVIVLKLCRAGLKGWRVSSHLQNGQACAGRNPCVAGFWPACPLPACTPVPDTALLLQSLEGSLQRCNEHQLSRCLSHQAHVKMPLKSSQAHYPRCVLTSQRRPLHSIWLLKAKHLVPGTGIDIARICTTKMTTSRV